MLKNRMIELTNMTDRKQRIGSKLTIPPQYQQQGNDNFIDVEKMLQIFAHNNEQMGQLKNEYSKTVNPSKQRQITGKVNKLAKNNQKFLNRINEKLQAINKKQKENYEKGDKADTLRVAQLNQKAEQLIKQYKDLQEKFTNTVKDNIRRQANFIQGETSEQQVQDIMRNPEKGQQMLRAQLINHPSSQLENAVSDIIDKYRDIVQLQKNMNQCLEMTQQLALLVAMTGQQLDNIEDNVNNAQDYTRQADQKLIKAKQEHKSAKKKKCCIIMLLLGVIGAILIPVLITQL